MSETEDGQVQFRCKLCKFTGLSKVEIANHFLNEHMEVEYVSPVKNIKSEQTNQAEGRDEITNSSQENAGSPKKKNKKFKDSPSKISLETKVGVDESEALGRGKRKRKKKLLPDMTDVKILRHEGKKKGEDEVLEDLVEESGWQTPESDDDYDNENQGKDLALNSKKRGRGRPRKTEKGKTDCSLKMASESKLQRCKSKAKIAVSEEIYSNIIFARIDEWEAAYKQKSSNQLFTCPESRCEMTMFKEEFNVHVQCHVPNMEGYRCPVCNFMCRHWRNMRHHYGKFHDQILGSFVCDYENCEKLFPKMCALRTHVMLAHIKREINQKLRSDNPDLSEFAEILLKTEITDEQKEGAENDSNNERIRQVEGEKDSTMDTVKPIKKKGPGRPRRSKNQKKYSNIPPSTLIHPDSAKPKKHKTKDRNPRRLVAFICDVCHAKYNDEEVMIKHKFSHFHEGRDEIHCTECEHFCTMDEEAIRVHVESDHKRMLHLHRCDSCSFSSHRYFDLKKHGVVHTGEKNFMCDKCGKCTTTPYNLKIHYRRMHASEDEKNIQCFSCDYKCADKAVLKDHIRQKHGLLVSGDEYQNPRTLIIYACPHCTYVGKKQSSLDFHMRIHREDRQFKCHLCPYASKTKNNLMLHIRTHKGNQPLKCPHCDFRAATNKIISEHVMCKHVKKRPYQCNICSWSTAYSGNMWKHIDNHQKDLGDRMPEFPVSVLTEGHSIPTPLSAPSGKKRVKKSEFKLKLARKRTRAKPHPISILRGSVEVPATRMSQVQYQSLAPIGAVVQDCEVMMTDGLTEEESIGSSALSRLAAAVASAQEVHVITPDQIITSQGETMPNTIQVMNTGGEGMPSQEVVHYQYTNLPNNMAQQILASGNGEITHVITTDHVYHTQQLQHQHHQEQQQQQISTDGNMHQAALQAGIALNSAEGAPAAIVEHVVCDGSQNQPGNEAAQNIITTVIPQDAELVMSMMQQVQNAIQS